MKKNAARLGDKGSCPAHASATVVSGHLNARANSLPMARAGDDCLCLGGVPSTVTSGASTVRVRQVPCARVWPHSLAHGGEITEGSPNVFVGGPSVTVSGRLLSYKACVALAAGRPNGSKNQNWGNCGPESLRQFINAKRAAEGKPPLSEDDMIARSIAHGGNSSWNPDTRGGLYEGPMRQLLEDEGIPAETSNMSPEEMAAAIAAGRPVGATVNPEEYWPPDALGGDDGTHFVVVFGVERDESGNIIAYWINDTSVGCGARIPAAKFERARTARNGAWYPTVTPTSPLRI